jgi:hypothetical protein
MEILAVWLFLLLYDENRSGYLTVENLRWKGERVYCIGHVRDMWGEPKELVYVSEVVVVLTMTRKVLPLSYGITIPKLPIGTQRHSSKSNPCLHEYIPDRIILPSMKTLIYFNFIHTCTLNLWTYYYILIYFFI